MTMWPQRHFREKLAYALTDEDFLVRCPASSRPTRQLTGHVSNHDSQYQCGQPLLQLGIIAATPITSPTTKNQSTCRPARPGAKRAQIHAHRIEMTTKNAVLAIRGALEGIRSFTKSPGNSRESNGSVPSTRTTDNK